LIDIFKIATEALQNVHPDRSATLKSWNAGSKDDSGKVTHFYVDSSVLINDQAITADRLQHLDGIDQSKTYRKIYLTSLSGTIAIHRGYDVIKVSDTESYKIEQLLEDWTFTDESDDMTAWCCVLGVLQ